MARLVCFDSELLLSVRQFENGKLIGENLTKSVKWVKWDDEGKKGTKKGTKKYQKETKRDQK